MTTPTDIRLTAIQQAVNAAGFDILQATEYADGVKAIVRKQQTFTVITGIHGGEVVTEWTYFTTVGILYTATADQIADSLRTWFREDGER
jgi:hypothetical protein